jgi:hypothetical protein
VSPGLACMPASIIAAVEATIIFLAFACNAVAKRKRQIIFFIN